MSGRTPSVLLAMALLEAYSIGTFSRFCDEPADFDSTSLEELAAVIDEKVGELDLSLVSNERNEVENERAT